MARYILISALWFLCSTSAFSASKEIGVRLKDLGRIEGNREVALIGYGIVVGLSGTGDSSRNSATLQSLVNTLSNFGLQVDTNDLNGKNVASVMVTAELPAFAEPGDKIDVRVASTGDAKSLSGGTLLLAPLYGPNNALYALSQGSLTVGGYQVESFSSSNLKNQTTVGQIASGATIERASPSTSLLGKSFNIILNEPDYTTANRIVSKIKSNYRVNAVSALHPGKIAIEMTENDIPMEFVARLENMLINPDLDARVVVNERTGTIVSGGNVILGEVSIAHGNLRIEIETKFDVSQPQVIGSSGDGVNSIVVPDTSIKVTEETSSPVQLPSGTSVGELVQALNRIKMSTRDMISILQSIKAAGALHADLIIQ